MCQNIFGVLKSLGHFSIVRFECVTQRKCLSLTFLVDVSYKAAFRVKKDFCMVLEIYLHDLIAQTEHDGMLCSHPLFHIN